MISSDVIVLDIQQGTEEWLEMRDKYITSTDAGIINGTNKWSTPLKRWQEKMGISDRPTVNFKMQEGTLLEKEARDWYNKKHNTNFEPICLMNKKYPWMFTSLDGYDKNTGEILEIKCGAATYDKISKGSMPFDYIDQAQHHICVSDQSRLHYVAYRPDQTPVDFFVERDQSHLDLLLPKEQEFYDLLIKMIPPTLSEKDFIENTEESSNKMALKWAESKRILNDAIKIEKALKQELFNETDDGNTIFIDAGVKVERIVKKGNIDYAKLLNDYKIPQSDLEKYRKADISYLQPRILKQA